MKTAKGLMIGSVVVILCFLVLYSQTGIPEGARKGTPGAAAGGYGGGDDPETQIIAQLREYAEAPALPGEEEKIKGTNPHLLAKPEDVEKNLGKWIIVDCRPNDLYDEGHIPTAIHLGETCNDFFRDDLDLKGIGVVKGLAIGQVEELERKLGKVGIRHDRTLLFYDQREDPGEAPRGRYYGIFAGYAFVPFWYMEYLGHKDVRVLDGGTGAWTSEGKSLEQKANALPPSQFKANVAKSRLATTGEVLKIAKKEEDAQLIDNRTIDEYIGKFPTPPGHFMADKIRRAGRIPNTMRNVPHFYQFFDPQTAKLKPIYQLQRLYGGLDKDKRTVLYCYIANRISLSYFVLRLLGFKDPAIYHDSWIVWGNDETLPVEKMKMVAVVKPVEVIPEVKPKEALPKGKATEEAPGYGAPEQIKKPAKQKKGDEAPGY
jgi:thiosulfate/3-mercaptopyruvate sulfurtransferase